METLVLNTYEIPVSIVPYRRALVLVKSDKAIVKQNYKDTLIRSSGFTKSNYSLDFDWSKNKIISMPIPSVIQCTRSTFIPKIYTNVLPFNRKNVYIRDGGKCMYCGRKVSLSGFSFDHVIPQSRGGKTSWENIVICCLRCNSQKGDKPTSKFKKPIIQPYAPKLNRAAPAYLVNKLSGEIVEETWMDYLYWEVQLES